jgi:hypothetical protein
VNLALFSIMRRGLSVPKIGMHALHCGFSGSEYARRCQSDDCFLPVPMAAICSLFDFSLPWERFHVSARAQANVAGEFY